MIFKEKIVNDIIQKYCDNRFLIDPIDIANRLGVNIVNIDESNGNCACLKINQNNTIIEMQNNLTESRLRFALSHSLGHLILNHGNEICDTSENYVTDAKNFYCKNANKFAAALLVPENKIKYLVYYSKKTISEMSSIFKVSEKLLHYRLKMLNII